MTTRTRDSASRTTSIFTQPLHCFPPPLTYPRGYLLLFCDIFRILLFFFAKQSNNRINLARQTNGLSLGIYIYIWVQCHVHVHAGMRKHSKARESAHTIFAMANCGIESRTETTRKRVESVRRRSLRFIWSGRWHGTWHSVLVALSTNRVCM